MRNSIRLVISSGKGGVGKSMLASALAMLFAKRGQTPLGTPLGSRSSVIAVDCDVDAPNLAVWLGEPENWKRVKRISVSEKPVIDNSKLTKKEAEQCVAKCRFSALRAKKGRLELNPFLCEGCGACEVFCPEGVIKMKAVKSGEIRVKEIYPIRKRSSVGARYRFPLISGQLYPGETGSGKVVSEIKKEADKFKSDIQIIDSAPGTGCPVIASLRDADFVVLVTEPTPSAFSDLKKVLEVVNHFKLSYDVVINKWDINPELSSKIKKWTGRRFLGKISYDKEIFKAVSNLIPIMETDLKAKDEIKKIFGNLEKLLQQKI